MLRIIYGLSTYLRNTQGWCEKYRRSLRRPRRFHGLAIRSLLITLRNGELSVSQVGRPLVHIAASVVVEAQWPATFEWLAAELLDEDRSARRFAFCYERTRYGRAPPPDSPPLMTHCSRGAKSPRCTGASWGSMLRPCTTAGIASNFGRSRSRPA